MIAAKSRAIRFFGHDQYQIYVRVADRYFTDNAIPIPSGGVETMESFWETIRQLIIDDLN
jgi:hypothetical protein